MKLKKIMVAVLMAASMVCCSDVWAATCKEEGSHESIDYIKKHYKNCSNCREENILAGKCAKNKKAHKHY